MQVILIGWLWNRQCCAEQREQSGEPRRGRNRSPCPRKVQNSRLGGWLAVWVAGLGQGEADGEATAQVGGALHGDGAVVVLGNGLGDRQAQA